MNRIKGVIFGIAGVIVLAIAAVAAFGVYKFNFTNDDIYIANEEPREITPVMSEAEARAIAENTCIKGGESLEAGFYNDFTRTWWFDANLNAVQPGCNPACVVDEATRTAEINWRCTGLQPSIYQK